MADDCLLGTDFISLYNVILDYKTHTVTLDDLFCVPLINSDTKERVIRTTKSVCIPPKSEAIIPVVCHKRFAGKQILLEPMPGRQFDKFGLARSLNLPVSTETVCRILNYADTSLVLPKGQSVAFVTQCVNNDSIQPLAVNRMSSEIIDKDPATANAPREPATPLSRAELDKFLADHQFKISDKAPPDEKYKLAALLFEFQDIFASDVTDMKSYTGQPFEIQLNSNNSSYRRQYKMPHDDAVEVERQIQAMRKANVVEPAIGNDAQRFNSSIMLVAKSDKSKRAVLDLRAVNKLISPVVVNLPPINDIVADLASTKPTILTTIDILSFFWQIGLAPGISRSVTSFTSPLTGERWSYTRTPFGLNVSSGFSQIALLNVIGSLITSRLIYCYCDDIVLPSNDYETHFTVLRTLFTDLRKGGLTININKSKFLFDHCDFLSHHIDASGYHMIPKYTSDVIRKFASPTNTRAVVRWVCFSSFYRRSIPGYAQKIAPIRALLKNNAEFAWPDDCERIFREVNETIISPPTLQPIQPDKEIYLMCDASKHGTCYSLHQKHGNVFHPCLFGGQALNRQQSQWPVHEQEIFSVVQCLHHHYSILSNMRIIVVTDNSCLHHWSTMHLGSNTRLKRWYYLFCQFSLEVIKVKGSSNHVDGPSRMFAELDGEERLKFTAKHTDGADDYILRTLDTPIPPPSDGVQFEQSSIFDEYTVSQLPDSTSLSANDSPRLASETETAVNAVQTRSAAKHSNPVDHPGSSDTDRPNTGSTAVNPPSLDLPPTTPSAAVHTDTDTDLLPFTALDDEVTETDFQPTVSTDNASDTDTSQQTNTLTLDADICLQASDYEADGEFKDMWTYKLSGELTGDDKRDRKTLLTADTFFILNNLLYRVTEVRGKRAQRAKQQLTRLCIPFKFTFDLVVSWHRCLNHSGYNSLLQALRERYYFSGLNELAYEVPRTCELCGQIKPSSVHRPPLSPHPPKFFNQSWALDHFHLTRPTRVSNYKFALVMVEMSTRWCEIALCHTTSALETSRHILEKIVAGHGIPHSLQFDRATSNINNLNKCLAELLSIKLTPSASRAKISNGLAERYVNLAKKALRFHCDKDEDIEQALPAVLIGLRSSPCKSLAASPFFMCKGYDITLPIIGSDASSPFSPQNTLKSAEKEFVENFATNLKEIQTRVQANSVESKEAMKREYDKRFHVQAQPYTVGCKVWLQQHIKAHSPHVITHRDFGAGPFYVTAIVQPPDGSIGPAYRLVHTLTGKVHKALVPAYRLKPCMDRESLIEKYKPEAAKPISSDRPPSTPPDPSRDNPINAQLADQSPTAALQPGFEPAVRIERQRKRGQSLQYLVLFSNSERYWCNHDDVTDELLRNWVLTRDKRRHRRRRKPQ